MQLKSCWTDNNGWASADIKSGLQCSLVLSHFFSPSHSLLVSINMIHSFNSIYTKYQHHRGILEMHINEVWVRYIVSENNLSLVLVCTFLLQLQPQFLFSNVLAVHIIISWHIVRKCKTYRFEIVVAVYVFWQRETKVYALYLQRVVEMHCDLLIHIIP